MKQTSVELHLVTGFISGKWVDVLQLYNSIWRQPLSQNTTLNFGQPLDAEHTCFLLYTETRWLSKCGSLARVFELWKLLKRFILKKQSLLTAQVNDTVGQKLAYSCDTFSLLNKLNLFSLQGENDNSVQVGRESSCIPGERGEWGNERTLELVSSISRWLEETELGPSFS